MKKVAWLVLMLQVAVFSFIPTALAIEDLSIVILIEGVALETDNPPFMEQDEVMVPVRNLSKAMGLDAFNAPGSTATEDIWVDDPIYYTRLIVYVSDVWSTGSRLELVEGGKIDNAVPPMIVNDCVYVPLNPFADAFGFDVQWDEAIKTATLTNRINIPFFADQKVNTTYSILNDRLLIDLPEGAEAENAYYGGIMGSTVDNEYETNLVLAGNDQMLEVKASEVYAYSTGDLEKDVLLYVDKLNSRYARPAVYSTSDVMTAEQITFIPIKPDVFEPLSNYLIEGALVRAADNTLLFVGVYADRKALVYQEDCSNLARKIIASLQSGTRLLAVDGQSFSMGDYVIQLRPGYVPKLNRGPDFDVWYFNELTTLDEVGSSFGIYQGNHPSYDDSEKPTKTVKDIVLSRTITWRLYAKNPEEFDENSYAEAILQTGASGWDTYMHIFASPSSESDWSTIRTMVRSLHDTNGASTFNIWVFCGFAFVVIILLILRVVHKRRKAMRLMTDE